ncbi:MAG TPA: S-methyl-5-thioribose-1-phosphate isomerase [Polyangiaceae bacterium]|jgi:methylthioribose-1-phosphate isomerase
MTWTRTLPAGRAHGHPEPISGAPFSAVELMPGDRTVLLLDQRKLPSQERYELFSEWSQVEDAIRTMIVRGAPAIGVAAAYALVLAAARGPDALRAAAESLGKARPTAVNLAHAIATMMRAAEVDASVPKMADVARAYHAADVAACKRIGALGQEALPAKCTVLTHCNAGALATGGYGTALGVVRAAIAAGKDVRVVACETRPLLQGARLTAWELMRDRIPVTLITDSMAASIMARGEIDAVIVGADRIARNGDVANKIGTYGHACLAHAHSIPFYVAAPWSTVDLACEAGASIPIEQRAEDEVLAFGDARVAPDGVAVLNPAFDVTPARLIRAIYTERGAAAPVDIARLAP